MRNIIKRQFIINIFFLRLYITNVYYDNIIARIITVYDNETHSYTEAAIML